jgi:hypothetical protein
MHTLRRIAVVGAVGLCAVSSASVVTVAFSATPAAAEGVCGSGASESGIVGGYMACVIRKTGRVFFVEI